MTPFEADKLMDHMRALFPRMSDAEYAWTSAEWDVMGHQLVAIKVEWDQAKAAADNYRAGCKTVVPKMAELIAAIKTAAYATPQHDPRLPPRSLRVDMYRREMNGGGGLTDVQVLSRHCRAMERDGYGTDYAMMHLADCLSDLGILRGEVLEIVAAEFGVPGEVYRDTILARWAKEMDGASKARDDHKAKKRLSAGVGAGDQR